MDLNQGYVPVPKKQEMKSYKFCNAAGSQINGMQYNGLKVTVSLEMHRIFILNTVEKNKFCLFYQSLLIIFEVKSFKILSMFSGFDGLVGILALD